MTSKIEIKEAGDKRSMHHFITFGNKLYRHCPQYVPDLLMGMRNDFNPKKNAALEFTQLKPFVAYRDGEPVGRVCAIINPHANEKWNIRVVRFGMFDFIDDIEVSKALLDAVASWGRGMGMDTMQGPMGITDFDKEGMLMSDYDQLGAMTEIYNYDYYPAHMERLGFKKAVDWVQIRVAVPPTTPERFSRVAAMVRKRYNLHKKRPTAHEIYKGYGLRIFHLLNEAYAPLFGFAGFTDQQANDFCHNYAPLVDFRMMSVVENEDNEPVGVAVTMASLAHALQRGGGRLLPLGWWWLLRALKWRHEFTVNMLLIAVRPDYQGKGVNALFFDDLIPVYQKMGFQYAETGPQLEDNIKEIAQWKVLNPQTIKRRRCWQKAIG